MNVWMDYIKRIGKPYKIFITKSDVRVSASIAEKRDKLLSSFNVEKIFVSAKRPRIGL